LPWRNILITQEVDVLPAQHRPSCAKQWRERATAEEWSIDQTVSAIEECCSVSRLRAHRLARGWTLREAVTEFHITCEQADVADPPRVDEDQLGVWEKRTDRRPRSATIDLLCRLYRTDAQGLGLTGDYREGHRPHPDGSAAAPPARPHSHPPARPHSHVEPSPLPAVRTARVINRSDPFDERVEAARRAVDRTLAAGSVSAGQLDLLDERIHMHRQQYIHTPPKPMLGLLLAELEEVQGLAAERQPTAVQARLSKMTALLSILVADSLMKLGNLYQSRAWYGTARAAADDSGNLELRARARVQAAMLPYYYGPLTSAIALTREARYLLSRSRPSAMAAFAAASEARSVARQGDVARAEDAIKAARAAFEQCDPGPEDDAFSFPERRFLLYLSGAYTYLGRTTQARAVQQQALRLYPDHTGIDPALLRLEAAICLARDHCVSEACQLAGTAYLQVPEEHRTPILGARAKHIIEVLPASMRSTRATRELGEILALPPAST
jgi:tetratricopeptide (TPR) repeat protein